jgi:hypothetical protein
MSTRNDLRRSMGASFFGLLLLVHLGSGFLHPCCLAGTEHDATQASMDGAHDSGHSTGHPDESPSPHHGTSDDDASETGCEGPCGLCCSTVDQVALVGPVAVAAGLYDDSHVERMRLYAAELPPSPAFLLPFSNGPPGSSQLLG